MSSSIQRVPQTSCSRNVLTSMRIDLRCLSSNCEWSQPFGEFTLLTFCSLSFCPSSLVRKSMGWDFNFGLLPYGEEWRHRHKVFHQSLQPKSPALQPVVLYYVYSLLRKLLETPEEFQEHIKKSGKVPNRLAQFID